MWKKSCDHVHLSTIARQILAINLLFRRPQASYASLAECAIAPREGKRERAMAEPGRRYGGSESTASFSLFPSDDATPITIDTLASKYLMVHEG